MRIFPLILLFAACQTPSPAPALQAAALQREVFLTSAKSHEDLVRRSNPPQATLEAYLAAAERTRTAYETAYAATLAAIGSLGTVSPEQIESTTAAVVAVVRELKQ